MLMIIHPFTWCPRYVCISTCIVQVLVYGISLQKVYYPVTLVYAEISTQPTRYQGF